MPLDWEKEVVERYRDGAEVQTMPGAAPANVTGADDERLYIKHRLWKDSLSRPNLEKAVGLLEEGRMTTKSGDFIDQYRVYVEDERPTMAAVILKDLGYLE